MIHKLTPVMAVIGLALSLLHQSSLGATYGVLSGRAIWFKPSLPVMFIISAVAAGTALTLLATLLTEKFTHRKLVSEDLKRSMARLSGYALLAYLYLKLWDWAATSYYSHAPETADALSRLEVTTPYSTTFWWFEILLGGLIPAIIFSISCPPQKRPGADGWLRFDGDGARCQSLECYFIGLDRAPTVVAGRIGRCGGRNLHSLLDGNSRLHWRAGVCVISLYAGGEVFAPLP